MSARVLVVDDILPNVRLVEAKLTNEYYEVLTATSGVEALEKVELEKPDIILLDVMMPGMDGFEVCTLIKKNPLLLPKNKTTQTYADHDFFVCAF